MKTFLLAAVMSCSAFDFATTEIGLNSGLREANPMASQIGMPGRVAMSVSVPILFWRSDLDSKPVAWTALAYAGIKCGAGLYNVSAIRRVGR